MPSYLRSGLMLALASIVSQVLPSAAQSNAPAEDRWQLTLDDQRYIWNVRLVKLAGDTLIVRQSDSLVRAPVARINEMRVLQQTTLKVGDGHESAISTLAGTDDEIYDLAQLDSSKRRSAIQSILARHSRSPLQREP